MAYSLGTLISTLLMSFADNSRLQHHDNRKLRALFCLLAALPLFLLSALRWDVGTDTWHTYTPEYLAMKYESSGLTEEEKQIVIDDYKLLAKRDWGYSEERVRAITWDDAIGFFSGSYKHTSPGFQMLERALLALDADVQWLYVVTSFITLSFVFAAIYMQSEDKTLAGLFFVITSNYFLTLNIVSQYIAVSICLFACVFAERRKPLPFFLLVLLAATFHVSALIFLPVYVLPRLRIKPLWCAIAVAAAAILAPVGFPLLEKLVRLFMPKYARYFGEPTAVKWSFLALGAAVFAAGAYYWKQGEDKPFYRLWFYANTIGLMALCFSGFIPNMKRVNHYFAAPHFLFLPLIASCEKNRRLRILLKILLVLLYTAETVIAVGMLNKNEVLPYQTFFSGNRLEMTEALLAVTS